MANLKRRSNKDKKVKKNKKSKNVKTETSVKAGRFTIAKGDDDRIIAEVSQFKGREYLNIRFQYLDDETWKYSSKGITIPFNGGLAEKFIEKFKKNF